VLQVLGGSTYLALHQFIHLWRLQWSLHFLECIPTLDFKVLLFGFGYLLITLPPEHGEVYTLRFLLLKDLFT
jgi:hypothetical protein